MSEEYQSHQIARIILRERFGIATDDEKQLLEAWLRESKERRWLYERVLSGETWREYADLKKDFEQMVDYGRLQNDILRSIRQRRQIRFRRRCVGWISVAAVLFVAVLMVARFRQQSVEPVRSVVALSDTVSMEIDDKVVLVLADGQKIGMSHVTEDSLRVGENMVARAGKKGLVYDFDHKISRFSEKREMEKNKVVTSSGGLFTLVLSDGTHVWLNSESELEYPVAFEGREREVRLRGEAVFEVASDTARPFYVIAGDVRTRVLGTSFNVKAYANDPAVVTTLFSGRVEVAPLKDLAKRVMLAPGRQAGWNGRNGEMTVSDADLRCVAAWKNGMFIFDAENIENITRQIERWYGVHFVYQISDKNNYTFSGYFSRYDSLQLILSEFTFMGDLEFQIKQDTIYVTKKAENKMEPLGR